MSDTEQPEVVCLCGSTRFKDEYRAENRRLTMERKIVLSVGLFGHADGHEFSDEEKEMLDALHKRKIDLADRIHVINVDGYIGDSTQSEIEYARQTDTAVTYLEQPIETDGGVSSSSGTEHFDQIPDALMKDNLAVRCMISEYEPDLCDGWMESFDISREQVKMDGHGRLYFPDNVTTECPECGDRVLEINGVEVNFHV